MGETSRLGAEPPYLACDQPAEGEEVDGGTTVLGWAFSPAGVRSVSVWLDGRRLGEAGYGGERPDVVAASGVPGALRSGFGFVLGGDLSLPLPRQAELKIVVEDAAGRLKEVRRGVRLVAMAPPDPTADAPGENAGNGVSPTIFPLVRFDVPAEGADLAVGGMVSGWAYSPRLIAEVGLWLDEVRLGTAVYGGERPDVVADIRTPDALRSGFTFHVPPMASGSLPRAAELIVVGTDFEGRSADDRRIVRLVEEPVPAAGSLDVPKRRQPWDPLSRSGWSTPLVIHGWAVDPAGVERIDVMLDGRVVGQGQHGLPREDVELLNPLYRRHGLAATAGWVAVIPTEEMAGGTYDLSATLHGGSGTVEMGPTKVTLLAESVRADPARRARLEALLRCPACGGELRREGDGLVCVNGDRRIPANEFGSLLFDETYAGLDWRDAVATSHGYPKEMEAIMEAVGDGLVLDVGAGLRENLGNIIQLDAIAFPTTDVSASADAMPFADESFDAVVACALLEHVSEPLKVIEEMRRVCKVGGRIYADWTSVHPYHGFPHQYFNATETGLDWAMREHGGADGAVQVTSGWITVRLILEQWLASLEDEGTRHKIANLSVSELVTMLRDAHHEPGRVTELNNVFPNGRRVIPPKVVFTGVRAR